MEALISSSLEGNRVSSSEMLLNVFPGVGRGWVALLNSPFQLLAGWRLQLLVRLTVCIASFIVFKGM